MHMRKDPSFFFMNKTSAPQGEKLGLMNALLSNSFILLDSSCISTDPKRYGDLSTGVAPGIKSIMKLTWRSRATPWRSSGNISGKFQTSGIP